MLKPSVQIHNMDGVFVAEFWDCLRLDPRRSRTSASTTRPTSRPTDDPS